MVKQEDGDLVEQEVYWCDHEKCRKAPIAVVQPVGNLYFGSSTDLDQKFHDLLTDDAKVYIIRISDVTTIDMTSLDIIKSFIRQYLEKGKRVIISGVSQEIYSMLEKVNIVTLLGSDNIFREEEQFTSANKAIEKAQSLLTDQEKMRLDLRAYL